MSPFVSLAENNMNTLIKDNAQVWATEAAKNTIKLKISCQLNWKWQAQMNLSHNLCLHWLSAGARCWCSPWCRGWWTEAVAWSQSVSVSSPCTSCTLSQRVRWTCSGCQTAALVELCSPSSRQGRAEAPANHTSGTWTTSRPAALYKHTTSEMSAMYMNELTPTLALTTACQTVISVFKHTHYTANPNTDNISQAS